MLKVLLLIILCLLICYVFYKVFIYYKSRQYFFENLCEFCESMQSQISFLKNDICSIIDSNASYYKKDFKGLIDDYREIVSSKKNLENSFKTSLDKLAILKEDEKEKLLLFFELLGRSDAENQVSQIENYKLDFKKNLHVTEKETNAKGSTYFKLGMLLSLAVFIIFI